MKAQREVRACVGCRLKPTTSMLALVSRRSLSRCIGTQTFCIRTHTALHALPTGEVNSSEPVSSITVLLLTRSDPRSVGAHYWAPPLSPSLAKLSSSGTRGSAQAKPRVQERLGNTSSSPEEPWESLGYICGGPGKQLRCTWVQQGGSLPLIQPWGRASGSGALWPSPTG